MAGIWYRAGTISVTNGSKKITGFGTLWKTSVLKPDKGHAFQGPDGRIYELDYVESDTVLYLVTAYLGPTATGQAYAIDVTRTSTIPALSREISAFSAYAQGQYDSWQKVLTGTGMVTLTAPDGQQVQVPALSAFQPTSASLKALQALTPAADRFGYFTGVNAAASTPLTPFARSLLDDVDAPSMLSTLGAIGSIGTITNQDWNAILTPGVYVVSNATGPNTPSTYRYGVLLVLRPVSIVVEQIYFPHRSNNGPVMRRQSYDSGATWPESWDGLFSRRTILGSVSQSGGIPTGALFEYGTNASGSYLKLPDGTLICRLNRLNSLPVNIGVSGLAGMYKSADVDVAMPYAFTGEPCPVIAPFRGSTDDIEVFAQVRSLTSTKITIRVMANSPSAGLGAWPTILVYGRWY
ncbi:pyocin knob domain-containing protein [Aeromonas caviae]|uniref:pyocin knob domain-containing protein n=1 Tax=Aeromonas caviae TaxID=648 RepID=UPI0022583703|nr:pyocin knob domain-containing protein [Aeromonas caviae]MCX4037770.1 pyocin knob domain-containing protein [Aeromonas caviae]